jgi:uncharacterized protein YjiS (DUF1127 family)
VPRLPPTNQNQTKEMIMTTWRYEVGGVACDTDWPGRETFFVRVTIRVVRVRVRRTLGRYIRHRAIRRAEKELMGLDDRMLRDIGLSRSEIGSAVRNPEQERLNGAMPPLAWFP